MKKNKKKNNIEKAKIQLVIFLVFMAFAFAYSKILIFKNNNIELNNKDININNLVNYEFNIKISVIENNIKNEYTYIGNINDNNGSITYNNQNYIILNNEYYDNYYNKIENLFYNIDNKYLDLNNIVNYLIDSNFDNNKYKVKLNIVVNNEIEEVYIYIDKNIIDNKIILNIDYTNLVNLKNSNINSYIIEYCIYDYV